MADTLQDKEARIRRTWGAIDIMMDAIRLLKDYQQTGDISTENLFTTGHQLLTVSLSLLDLTDELTGKKVNK